MGLEAMHTPGCLSSSQSSGLGPLWVGAFLITKDSPYENRA